MNSASLTRANDNSVISNDRQMRLFSLLLIILVSSLSASNVALLPPPVHNYTYAQTDDAIVDDNADTADTPPTAGTSSSAANTPTIEIISHQDGDQLPSGEELTIEGVSSDNEETDCQVYADLRGIDPYQNTSATGPGGEDDFSAWTFTYTEAYQLPTPGINDITSKITCFDGPVELSEWNSINVTGVASDNVDTSQQTKDGLGDSTIPVPMPSISSPSETGPPSSDDDEVTTGDEDDEGEDDEGEDDEGEDDEDEGITVG